VPERGRKSRAQGIDGPARDAAVPHAMSPWRGLVIGIVILATATLAVRFFAGAASTATLVHDSACHPLSPDPLSPRLHGLAPDFELSDKTGKRWSLHALRGRPVLVSFWATWCQPCVEEIPSLETLARRLGDQAVILAVSVDENWDAIHKFFPRGTPLTVLLDPSREIPARYGTSKFPESFLIDPTGHVRHAFINQRDWSGPEATSCIASMK
jgi:cytochrome c biogenesis protein CcmG, thiol:disulfide interchange protein DsbE